MQTRLHILLAFALVLFAGRTFAQTISVSPSDVNAYSQGATSVLLTFGGIGNKRVAEATWCGALIPAGPDLGMKCDPATVFGRLPARYDQSTRSRTNAFTDIMSITPQVARRAYLDAAAGNRSTLFYVRRFVGIVDTPIGLRERSEYVPVTIRLSGNGAGVPLSLTEVKLSWGVGKPILFVKRSEKLPRFKAEIAYTGTGRLKGRWELVKPGETPPVSRDLVTEASLPIEERGMQRRFSEISRFNIYLPPTGKIVLPGPEVWRLDQSLTGLYIVLLRVEASDDKASDTNLAAVRAGGGIVHGGAVAGFSLPVLKYYVSNDGAQPTGQLVTPTSRTLRQTAPEEQAVLPADKPVHFTWTVIDQAKTYRLEVEGGEGHSIISAILRDKIEPTARDAAAPRNALTYRAPSWLKEKVGPVPARWRVVAFDAQAKLLKQTDWRSFRFSRVVTLSTGQP